MGRLAKIAIFFLILIFWGSFLVYKIALPGAQDLPRQMKNGEGVLRGQFEVTTKNVYSYTEPDHSFANHHWLYGVVVYILHKTVSWSGMVLFKVIFMLFMFAWLFYITLKKNDFWLVAFFSIPTILILISRTALRPEIFSYFLVVTYLYFLTDLQDNPKHNRVWLLVPLQIFWVNTHLFFPIGILFVAGFLFQNIILNFRDLKKSLVVRKLGAILLLLCLVIFINPFGLRGALFSLQVNSDETFPVGPAEIGTIPEVLAREQGWDALSASVFLKLVSLLAISFVAGVIFRIKSKKDIFAGNFIFYFIASVGASLISYFVIRGLPLFGLIFLPAICSNLNGPFLRFKEKLQSFSPKLSRPLGGASVLVLGLVLIGLTAFGQKKVMARTEEGVGLAKWSESSANFFIENDIAGPVFNDSDIGSYLIYYLYPREKVFTDNRFGDAYSAEFFREKYLPLIQDEEKWREGMEKYSFNVIFFYHYDNVEGARDFLFRRINDDKWAWVYADPYAVILLKVAPENQELIDNFQITPDNLIERLSYLSDSKNSEDVLSAADIFNLIGRTDLSMPLYLKVVSQDPEAGKVWMVLGKTELTKADQENSNPYLAAIYLERAIAEGWKTWESYSFLTLSYYRTGQIDRAREAVNEELRIDPGNEDGIKWLDILNEREKETKEN